MSSLLEFLQKKRKLNWKFWFRYYHQHILGLIYNGNIKQDNSWKGVKIKSTCLPEKNWNELTENQKMLIQEEHWKELNLNFKK